MATLAALLPDSARMNRLTTAARDAHTVLPCASWVELEQACKDDTVSLAILDLFADGKAQFDVIRRLKLRAERITIIAYVTATPQRARDLFDAGRAGIDGLLIAGEDDTPAAFRAVLERAEARGVAHSVRPHLKGYGPIVQDAVLVAITRAHLRLTSQRLVSILSTNRRTLLTALSKARCPAPQQLITWGRLVVAAQMLEDIGRTADGVARALDFPSGSAFRNTCQRYLGATPQEIRANGGVSWVVGRFIATLGSTS
jgi:AraC-like DNA-binding protein